MTELILTPIDVMGAKAQALTAPAIGTTVPHQSLDDSSGSYAEEVAAMTGSARSPVSIVAGLGAGYAGYHFSQRLAMLPKGAVPRQLTLASLGLASALIGHATTSWALYSLKSRPDTPSVNDGLLQFGSLTQAVVSAVAIVGVYGGIRYAYALHSKGSRRGLADQSGRGKAGRKNTYDVELYVVEQGNAADDGTFNSIVGGSASTIAKAARALLQSSRASTVAIVNDGEDVAYIKRGKPMAFHTVNFEPNKTLRRELKRATQGTRKKTTRKSNLADCTPILPTVAP